MTSPPSPETTILQPGDLVLGKYRVERFLGAGAMGAVVALRHVQLNQDFALKFIPPPLSTHGKAVARFLREARAAARLKSEHVVHVFDVGTLPIPRDRSPFLGPDGTVPYLVMEYVEGSDLRKVLIGFGRFPIGDAVTYLLQVCEAVAEAHALGIVHRDLKPENLLLTQRPNGTALVKVIDFGISKSLDDERLTDTATTLGTPLYMAPEQMASAHRADPRSDIWSLATILYEFLTGIAPFASETVARTCGRILTETPLLVRALRPEVPEELERVLLRGLEKSPADRWSSVEEFASALQPFASTESPRTVSRIPPMSSSGLPRVVVRLPLGASTSTQFSWNTQEAPLPNRRWKPAIAIGALALAGLGMALVWVPGAPVQLSARTFPAPAAPVMSSSPNGSVTVVPAEPEPSPTASVTSHPSAPRIRKSAAPNPSAPPPSPDDRERNRK